MRWSIPTLIQQLVDQGVQPKTAGQIVAAVYPETHGDTFYRSVDPADPGRIAVGVYGLWNDLRADRVDLGGTKVSDDARTIAQFLRLNGGDWLPLVRNAGDPDPAVITVAQRTVEAIQRGDYFSPQEIRPDPPSDNYAARMAAMIARTDGAADYLRALTPPLFGV